MPWAANWSAKSRKSVDSFRKVNVEAVGTGYQRWTSRQPANPLRLLCKRFVGRIATADRKRHVKTIVYFGVLTDSDSEVAKEFARERNHFGKLLSYAQASHFGIYIEGHGWVGRWHDRGWPELKRSRVAMKYS